MNDAPLPGREAILAFLGAATSSVGKREIARAFGLHGAARLSLKLELQAMEDAGLVARGPGHSLRLAGRLPPVAVLLVVAADGGRVLAAPERWDDEGEPPRVRLADGGKAGSGSGAGAGSGARAGARLTIGDRLLVRISGDQRHPLGHVIRRLGHSTASLIGMVRKDESGRLVVQPLSRRQRQSVPLHHGSDALPGDLVRAEVKGRGGRAAAQITARLGNPLTGALSAIAIADKGIPAVFSDSVLAEAQRAAELAPGARDDWTAIPFVTIDPDDARDRDDAVHAERHGDGWRLLVAIADVSWFVRPGTALDRSAFDRGNSVYFPDGVVPMLPEILSAGACSLNAGEPRAALAARIDVAADGALSSFSFHRVRIRVAENLAYGAVQQQIDSGAETPLCRTVLRPLWDCWRALDEARRQRGPLALDLPETRILLDSAGRIADVRQRERLDAHRVIEEMMIAANIAAARALEERRAPLLYRCHEVPDRDKLVALKEYLGTLGIELALGQVITSATFNRVLERTHERTDQVEIAEAVLRAQQQAYYAPRNTGHFGLQLPRYAHFTSPIRRYSDLVVHRSLVRAFSLGDGGLPDGAEDRLAAVGEHLSLTERRAMEAERDTRDRYLARHYGEQLRTVVSARITGVQAFGFFARTVALGGEGLVPVSALGAERFRFDEAGRFLEGVETGTRYRMGQVLDLRLEEADIATAALRFSVPGVDAAPARERRGARRPGAAGKGLANRGPSGRGPAGRGPAGRGPSGRGSPRRRG